MKKFVCDASEANEAMRHRRERFESLAWHIGQGIKVGIAAHNTDEGGLGFLQAMPEEISQSLAEAVTAHILRRDRAALERFIEDLHLSVSEDGDERIDTL